MPDTSVDLTQQSVDLYEKEVKEQVTCLHHCTQAMKKFPNYDVEEFKRNPDETVIDYMERIVTEIWYAVAILGELYEVPSDTDSIRMMPLEYRRSAESMMRRSEYMHGVAQLQDVIDDERFETDYHQFVSGADNSLAAFYDVWDSLV